MTNDSKPVELVLAAAMVDHVARALAAAEGHDWSNGRAEVQAEWLRAARVAVGAAIEFMVEQKIRVVA